LEASKAIEGPPMTCFFLPSKEVTKCFLKKSQKAC
jgi:hypothetical protein